MGVVYPAPSSMPLESDNPWSDSVTERGKPEVVWCSARARYHDGRCVWPGPRGRSGGANQKLLAQTAHIRSRYCTDFDEEHMPRVSRSQPQDEGAEPEHV